MKSIKFLTLIPMFCLVACNSSNPFESSLPQSFEGLIFSKYVVNTSKPTHIKTISKKENVKGKSYQMTYVYGYTQASETDELLYVEKDSETLVYRYNGSKHAWLSTSSTGLYETAKTFLLTLNDLKLDNEKVTNKAVSEDKKIITYTYNDKTNDNVIMVTNDKYHLCVDYDRLALTDYAIPAKSNIPHIDLFEF